MSETIIELLRKDSKSSDFITKSEIVRILKKSGLVLSDDAIRQRIYVLSENGLLQKIKRGIYSFNLKPAYSPDITNEIKKISQLFVSSYPEINYCIWSQSWLHDFMNHQPFNYSIIFETESDMVETAFNLFRDNRLNSFLNPGKDIVQNYTNGPNRSILVRKMIYRSPVNEIRNVNVPAFEKILVDIFCDRDIQFLYQGTELKNIFSTSLRKFNINFSLLLRYAATRNQKSEIKDFLISEILIPKNLLQ
jgi:phosphopantetheine adenylyltransferase